MGERPSEDRAGELVDAVCRLTAAVEQVVGGLARLEAQNAEAARKQDEDRAEAKERQRQFDADQEDFRRRQKRWDERDERWESQDKWGGLGTSTLLCQAKVLLFVVALAALAVAQCAQVSRH